LHDRLPRQRGVASTWWTVLGGLLAVGALIALADDTPLGGQPPVDQAPSLTVAVGQELSAEEAEGAIPIVVTGNVQAMLQWCACETGTGFLAAKRATVIRQERGGAILLDAGEAFSGDSDLDRQRGETQLRIMESLGYDAALLGPDAFALGTDFATGTLLQSKVIWACANLVLDGRPRPAWGCIREFAGRKVALIALVSEALWIEEPRTTAGVTMEDPLEAYSAVVKRERPDVAIAYGRLSEADARRLSACERAPEAVFTSTKALRERLGMMGRVYNAPDDPNSGYVEYPNTRGVLGATAVYFTDVLGPSGLISVRLGRRSQGYWHLQATGRTHDDPATKSATDGFFAQVRDTARQDSEKYAKSAWKDELAAGRRFVGAQACRECHEPEWTQWSGTKHANAYAAVTKSDRWFYPACVACHSTGLGHASGFEIDDAPMTPLALYPGGLQPGQVVNSPLGLEGVQCEACHGPGSRHVGAPSSKSTIDRTPATGLCVECHDEKNSPGFAGTSQEYRERVAH